MIRGQVWGVALDSLRTNKVKAFLTMLGVVIGSACIVLVVTVSLTGRQYIIAQIEGVGSNIVYAEHIRSGQQRSATLADELTLEDLAAVRALPQIVEAAATHDLPSTMVVAGIERPVNLVGVTLGFQRIRNLVILRGRYFDAGDMEARSKVCLLTEELAQRIFHDADPIGQDVRVGELNFTVVGVFRERIATFGQSEITRESVLIPFSLIRYYTGAEYIRVLYAQAAGPQAVPAATLQVSNLLHQRHREGAEYRVENLSSILDAAGRISVALSLVLLVIALIALLISGVGIMNIMLVTVTERTREIGVRKAIGARSREILYQFLIEAFLISGSGALGGVLIAVSIPLLAQPFLPPGITIPISGLSILLAIGVSVFTGILFGYLPASKAARLPPTEALRYE